MASEILPHARLEDRHIPFGMQSAAVNDGHASVAMAATVDELFHVRDGFIGGLAVQVEHAARRVVAALEFSEFAPIDTGRGVSLVGFCPIVMTG
jgi:hypothetical protein